MEYTSYHNHSCYSDGQFYPEDYLKQAIQQKLIAYGFSDHAPISREFIAHMPQDKMNAYLAEFERLKEKYFYDIEIYKGLEVDYIPNVINIHSDQIINASLDYTIGAVHYLDYFENGRPWGFEDSIQSFNNGIEEIFNGDIQTTISRYYSLIREMAALHTPDIIAHLDRIKKFNKDNHYFNEQDLWYREEVLSTLHVIARTGCIMEVNTKGYYNKETIETYPSQWVLEAAFDLGIPVLLSSDAHHPNDITRGFDYGTQVLQKAGYDSVRVLQKGHWQDVAIMDRSRIAV